MRPAPAEPPRHGALGRDPDDPRGDERHGVAHVEPADEQPHEQPGDEQPHERRQQPHVGHGARVLRGEPRGGGARRSTRERGRRRRRGRRELRAARRGAFVNSVDLRRDKDIYKERIELGRRLIPRIVDLVDGEVEDTVFSFIPNTAEVSFYGMVKGMEDHFNGMKYDRITALENPTNDQLKAILDLRPRVEKVAWKDVKLRTFITEDSSRDELVSHVYDITHGSVKPTDHLVAIDDSIVRGTTLKQSILRIFDRLSPKHIVIASSAPQIRYPDCYGIDMARMGDFVAFRAAIALLKERGQEDLIQTVYEKCKAQSHLADHEVQNFVKDIYEPFEAQEISDKIAELLTPPDVRAKVTVLYQTIEDLHLSCPDHPGDWYFTGDYPTPGGNRVVNKSFMYYVEGRTERAY